LPVVEELQDNTEEPEPETLAGLYAPQFKPLGLPESEKVTVPEKPFTAATEIVEFAS